MSVTANACTVRPGASHTLREEDIRHDPLLIPRNMLMDEVKWSDSMEHETLSQDKGWKWHLEHKKLQVWANGGTVILRLGFDLAGPSCYRLHVDIASNHFRAASQAYLR